MAGATAKTPQSVKGTFIPPVETPRRSPRLAAKRLASAQSVGSAVESDTLLHTPTREKVRKLIQQREGTTSLFDEVEAFVRAHSKILETSVVTTEVSNKLQRYLVVTRKLKVFDDVVGPHDALRLLVAEDGHYRLLLYEKALEEGTVQSPITHSGMPILEKLEDAQWIICPGVKSYSSFKASIGFDIKAAVEVFDEVKVSALSCNCRAASVSERSEANDRGLFELPLYLQYIYSASCKIP